MSFKSSYIRLHTSNEKVVPICTSLSCDTLLDYLPKLLREPRLRLSHGFWIELGVSSDTHVFVARDNLPRDDSDCVMDVYALDVQNGGRMQQTDAYNTARSTFDRAFSDVDSGNLTAYYFPSSRSADDEQGYPCGTIFTIGPTRPVSDSSQDSSQAIRCSPRLLHPTYVQESADFYLLSPTPAENSDDPRNSSTRKGTGIQVEPVSLFQQEDPNLFGKTAGNTESQLVFQGTCDGVPGKGSDVMCQNVRPVGDIEGVSTSAKGVVMSPAEESSTSAESCSSKVRARVVQPGSGMRTSEAMVTGHLPRRSDAIPVTQGPTRRLSLQVNPNIILPIPEDSRLAPQGRTRAFSDLDNTMKYRRTSWSDPDGEQCPITAVDGIKIDCEASSGVTLPDNNGVSLAEPVKPVLLRSTSGPPTATSPVLDTQRPLLSNIQPPRVGVERQASQGDDEIVVGIGKKIVHDKDPPIPGSNIAIVVSDTTEVKELQVSLGGLNLVGSGEVPAIQVNGAPEACAEAVLPFKPVALHNASMCTQPGMELLGVSEGHEGRSSEDWRSSASGSGSFSERPSETDLYQVHLLGHACNQKCNSNDSKMGCRHASDPSFAEGVKQMSSLVQSLKQGNCNSEDDLKRYIRIHCYWDCPGKGCLVPHRAAGCSPPSVRHVAQDSTSPSVSNLTRSSSFRLRGLMDCSIDEARAFDSTTPPDLFPEGIQGAQPREQMKLPLHGNCQPTRFMEGIATPTPNGAMTLEMRRFHGTGSPMFSKGGIATPYRDGRDEHHQFANSPLCLDPHSQLPTPRLGTPRYPHLGLGTPQGYQRTLNHRGYGPGTPQSHEGVLNHEGYSPQELRTPDQTPICQGPLPHQGYALNGQGYPHQQLPTPGHASNYQGFAHGHQGHRFPQQIYQVSNEETDLGRAYQFQRYDSQGAARFRQLNEHSRQQLPDVGNDGFPECRAYKSIKPWTVIHSAQKCQDVLTLGFTLPHPQMDKDRLGKGGNGKVSRHFVDNRVFAIKETNYRRGELNAWRKLSHDNLVPLLGVMWGQNNQTCYQFMPYMSHSLSEVMHKVGCLEKLSKSESTANWRIVMDNVWCHILTPVLQGLKHLESLNMQHCDVKASNILISKPDTCSCQDVLHCTCPEDRKFKVMLADYDSLKETEHCRVARNIPHVECSFKSPDQLKKVMGTIAYRAPEKFVLPKSPPPSSEATPADHGMYLEGPWCDIWSFGMVVTRLVMGRDTDADKRNANILKDQPHCKDLTPNIETTHAMIKLKGLHKAATGDINLKQFADLADTCLEPDFRLRLTPGQLLDIMKKKQAQS